MKATASSSSSSTFLFLFNVSASLLESPELLAKNWQEGQEEKEDANMPKHIPAIVWQDSM